MLSFSVRLVEVIDGVVAFGGPSAYAEDPAEDEYIDEPIEPLKLVSESGEPVDQEEIVESRILIICSQRCGWGGIEKT